MFGVGGCVCCLVFGARCLVVGVWCLVFGVWCLAFEKSVMSAVVVTIGFLFGFLAENIRLNWFESKS